MCACVCAFIPACWHACVHACMRASQCPSSWLCPRGGVRITSHAKPLWEMWSVKYRMTKRIMTRYISQTRAHTHTHAHVYAQNTNIQIMYSNFHLQFSNLEQAHPPISLTFLRPEKSTDSIVSNRSLRSAGARSISQLEGRVMAPVFFKLALPSRRCTNTHTGMAPMINVE